MPCALCGNESSFDNVSFVDAKSSEDLLISLCNHCGLVQQNPIPSTDELSIYYSHNYRKEYKNTYTPKTKHVFRAGRTAQQRIDFMAKNRINKGTLLDVGAGGGEFVYLSNKSGFQAVGIEPNIQHSEYASNEYKCKVQTGELDDINGKYDVITIFHVMEHLPSPLRAFEKLYNHLNENGQLFVEVPWLEAKDASPKNIYFKAHIFYFSIDTLIACASPYFDVKKVDTSSNLKILFTAKSKPTECNLPSAQSVQDIRKRLQSKSWFEYLIKGKGYVKPAHKIKRIVAESKAKGIRPKKILDEVI